MRLKYDDLTPGQKESNKVKLNGYGAYELKPAYDHRFITRGKEDLAPNAGTENIEWFDDKTFF